MIRTGMYAMTKAFLLTKNNDIQFAPGSQFWPEVTYFDRIDYLLFIINCL